MISCKENALEFFRKTSGKTQFNKQEFHTSIEFLQKIASDEGLSEDEIDSVVKFLSETKINAQEASNLFHCLIPKTNIPRQSLEGILLWFFTEVGNDRVSNALGKKCLQWLTGISYYELADLSVIQSYYYSFIFLLSKPHLESCICRLLCLISKPEDAKRWLAQQIFNIPNNRNPKPYTYALLSLLKSYRANVVPERIPLTNFHYTTTPFDETMKKAYDRKLNDVTQTTNSCSSSIQWNIMNLYDEKNRRLNKLIPSADSLHGCSEEKVKGRKLQSVYDFKTMSSLGVRPFMVQCPAEVLSLLANQAGHHILAFGDFVLQARFFHKLYHTLCRVYLFELETYSENEKMFFMSSLKELQDYSQQSIPVVTTFLFYYLPIWDGEDSQEQILNLLEWLEIRDEDDLEKYVFPSLKQIFISSGTHCKVLIIKTLGKLLRNLLIMEKREQNCFTSNFQNCSVNKCIEAIHAFISGLISNGLIWNNEKKSRNILNAALDFYETTLAVEEAWDLPLIMSVPPAVVYTCLFSGSRVCIARICSILVRLQETSVERLCSLGVYQDFAVEVKKLNIFMLDYYRCLWSKLSLQDNVESFIFQHDIFTNKFWKLKEIYGGVMDKIFGIEYNASFWDPKAKGLRQVVFGELTEDYPAIVRLKQVVEERFLQAV